MMASVCKWVRGGGQRRYAVRRCERGSELEGVVGMGDSAVVVWRSMRASYPMPG